MKLTIAEIAVIMDTFMGSLRVVDGVGLFGYTYETRKRVLQHITQQADQQQVQVVVVTVDSNDEKYDNNENKKKRSFN